MDEPSATSNIYLARFDGNVWTALGSSRSGRGISDTTRYSFRPVVALDSQNRPVVAWYEDHGSTADVYVRRWDGAAWVEYGCSGHAGGVSATGSAWRALSLVLDAGDQPIVAWENGGDEPSEILARRWDGAAWVGFHGAGFAGGVSNSCAGSYDPELVKVGARICLSWSELADGTQQVLLRCTP